MLWLIAGLLVFLGVHSVSIVARGWRDRMVQRLGERPWKGLYTIASGAGFALLVMGYGLARQDPVLLYAPPAWTRHLMLLLMLPVFPMLLSAHLPGRIKATLKHPLLAATKLWAVAHLIANGGLHDVLLFGGFLLWAVADRIAVKKRAGGDAPPAVGPARNDVIAVVAGLALYVLFVGWAHGALIGVPLLPGGQG
jgi:uncharacterized membrane protein